MIRTTTTSLARLRTICALSILFAALLASRLVGAAGEQAYFTAMVGPLGSISAPGQGAGETAVYLRWDVVEGAFPGDLSRFRLKRDGVVIHDTAANVVMSVSEIDALYAGPNNARRLNELVAWLNRLATDEDPPVPQVSACGAPPVTAANVACVLRARLATDPYWAFLAARNDFNVARAYRRGYLDQDANGLAHSYELLGVDSSNQEVRIGLMQVDATAVNVLPRPADFIQVEQFGRCDAPEKHKDHASVVLNWDNGTFGNGNTAGDRYVAALLTTGFDLFRTTENIGALPVHDIRALARVRVSDSNGEVALPGLEKVNEQPIRISGHAEKEQIGKGWHPPYFQYLRTGPEILAEGLKPGDTRGYYLVARDLTGNYGATKALAVTIPDAAAPPPPWAMRTIIDPAADTFKLQWDAVNLQNFVAAHQGRTFCNLATAVADKELRWVKQGDDCASGFQVPVDLDVDHYLVYRFTGTEEAARFSDADGDGRADVDERAIISVDPPLTDVGTACVAQNPAVPPLFAKVPAAAVQIRASGRRVVELPDSVPATAKSDVFWYRIASVDSHGNIGPLSAPLRALYPFRHKPGRCRDPLRVRECPYQVDVLSAGELGSLFAEDTTGDADSVVASCQSPTTGLTIEHSFPIDSVNGTRGVAMTAEVCAALRDCAGLALGLGFFAGTQGLAGASLGSVPQAGCSAIPRARLRKDCSDGRSRPVRPGETVDPSLLEFDCPTQVDECVTLHRDIGGVSYHYATNCPGLGPVPFDPADWANLGNGEQLCFSASIHNQNNEVSTKTRLPCFRFPTVQAPDPPQPVEISFSNVSAEAGLHWLPPQQHVTGTIAEWSRKGVDENGKPYLQTSFFAHAGQAAADGTITVDVPITPAPPGTQWEQEWCFRARSVGQGGPEVLSGWSPRRCAIRVPVTAELPNYIPWPKIDTPPEIGNLLNRYLSTDGRPVVRLSESEIDLECTGDFRRPRRCEDDKKDACLDSGDDSTYEGICENFCQQMKESLAGKLGFVVYRQSTDDIASPARYGDYVQVSPYIDRLFCATSYALYPNPSQVHMNDPFVRWTNFAIGDPEWDGLRLVFQDATPHIEGMFYRYQLVYFGPDGEILGHRQTDWLDTQ